MREICTSGSEGGWGGKPPWSTRLPSKVDPRSRLPGELEYRRPNAKAPAERPPLPTPRPPAQRAQFHRARSASSRSLQSTRVSF